VRQLPGLHPNASRPWTRRGRRCSALNAESRCFFVPASTALFTAVPDIQVAKGYALTDDLATADQFALVAYGVDDGKSEVVSYPVYGQTGGGSTYSSGTVSTSSGMASYTGSSYQMPQYGVVGNGVGTVTVFTRVFALDILDGNSFRANAPKKLLELRSKSSGSCSAVATAIPYVIEGAFIGFPAEDGKVSKANVRPPKELKC